MREIRIREMALEEARWKLEQELNDAFMAGESRVRVLHGIGTGRLKKMTHEVAESYDFVKIVPESSLTYNPGITVLDLFPPDRSRMRMIRG